MVNLTTLDEESMVHNLKLRFESGDVYTSCGHIIVSVNPFRWLPLYSEDIVKQYHTADDPFATEPPHVYAITHAALSEVAVELGRRHETAAPSLDVQMLFDSYGLDDGEVLLEIIDAQLEALGLSRATTFASLHRLTKKDFCVCATNMHTRTPVYFSRETSPQLPLREALFMSMCVPFIFRPRRFRGDLHADGGMSANVPFGAFPGER